MKRFTRRDSIKLGAGTLAGAALLGSGRGVRRSSPPATWRRPICRSRTARACACCGRASSSRATRPCSSRTPRSSPRRPASTCASTARAGRTCARRPRSPPTSAAVPTSCSPGATTRTSSRPRRSTSPTSPPTSARSTAAGIRWPRSTAPTRRGAGSRCRSAPRAAASSTASPGSTKPATTTIPEDLDGFLQLARKLQESGRPIGLALGNAVGDGNAWCNWVVWAHGGAMIDEEDNVTINSPETIEALKYAKALYETFIPGTLSWLDPSNNKAYPGRRGLRHPERHLDLLRGQELGGSRGARDRRGHLPCAHADRARGDADRALPDGELDGVRLHALPERRQGVSPLHDGGGAVRAVSRGLHRLLEPSAAGLRGAPDLDRRSEARALRHGDPRQPVGRLQGQPRRGLGGGAGRLRRSCRWWPRCAPGS